MRSIAILFLLGCTAMAAETLPGQIPSTLGEYATSDQLMMAAKLFNPPPMAAISRDGEVTINWVQVEKTAADEKSDPAGNRAYARLMLAIRDGTWKPVAGAPEPISVLATVCRRAAE